MALKGIVSGYKYRNLKILKHAKGQDCQMRLPGVCNHNPETVVAAHSNALADGKGMGTKAGDHLCAYICASCHDAYDGRIKVPWMHRHHIEEAFYAAMRRTWTLLLRDGILK